MGLSFDSQISAYQIKQRRRRRWYKLVSILACVVVFCTTYALILPAITMEIPQVLDCPLEVHTHREDCYDAGGDLICGQADFVVHTHTEDCYDAGGSLVCTLPEIEVHAHTDQCYTQEPVLLCGQEEGEGHQHDESCYTLELGDLLCGQEEDPGHQHDESCYTLELGGLICGNEDEDHVHTDGCYEQIPVLTCGLEEGEGAHTHTEDCYERIPVLTCGQEEGEGAHTHTEDCYGETVTALTCGKEEIALHTHTEDCYDEDGGLICGQLEVLEHVHTEDCFADPEAVQASLADAGIMLLADGEESSFTLTYNGYTITFNIVDANGNAIPGEYSEYNITGDAATLYKFSEIVPEIDGYTYGGAKYGTATVVSVATTGFTNPDGDVTTSFSTAFQIYENDPIVSGQWYSKNTDTVTLTYVKDLKLDGMSFALFNPANKAAMLASSTTTAGKLDARTLSSFSPTLDEEDGYYYLTTYSESKKAALDASLEDILIWSFEPVPDQEGKYYLTTTTEDGTKQYVQISGADVTLVGAADDNCVLTVTEGAGTYAGQVRLTNSSGRAINKYGSKNYFGGYSDNGANEYFYLVAGTKLLDLPGTVSGVTPAGTVINMFDYWAVYNGPTYDENEKLIGGDYSYSYEQYNWSDGINEDHFLKFTRKQDAQGSGTANAWTGTAEPYQGIVQRTLVEGSPVLTAGLTSGVGGTSTAESLAYLFDPDTVCDYRKTYRNVGGLLQVDEHGYYYYDSQKNFAELDTEKNQFTLYNRGGVQPGGADQTLKGQFFPFNKLENVSDKSSASDYVNHYFGLTMTTRFVHRHDGYTAADKQTPVEFEFAGDDDVWIFVDDVLVADLGGIHDRASVNIDFSTGNITINGNASTTLYEMFEAAGKENSVEWSTDTNGDNHSDTFANDTYHTLRFFFLERGNTDSNLHLKYNLASYPPTSITKVNQYGAPVSGAEFSVYKAASNYSITQETPAYTGTTDSEGKMVFVDQDNMPYTMDELETMFGEYFVLKETGVPPGYRLVSEEIRLHISSNVLLCENTWDSGVWAETNLLASAPNTVKLANGTYNDKNTVDAVDTDGEENGKIFAVVLKYTGDDVGNASEDNLKNEANWAPLYGTAAAGFTILDQEKWENLNISDFISAAIYAANQYVESQNEFALGSSGALEGTVYGMPGDVGKYYYMLPDDEKGQTEYTVAYYWTSANMEDATADNTYRIDADAEGYAFDRVFGATINVPNLINELYAQKFDEEGQRINGATFALYKVEEDEDNQGTIYYLDGSNKPVSLDGADYTINPDNGWITGTTAEGVSFTIYPYQLETAMTAENVNNKTKEEGTAIFSLVEAGRYYLREIAAPRGYEVNETEVMVYVTANALYANAGNKDDGITVARGPGYIADPLNQFASWGDVNNTLTWVYEKMQITGESNTFTAFNDTGDGWAYLTENKSSTTVKEGEAPYTVHLIYDNDENNKLFNFTVNEDWYKNWYKTQYPDATDEEVKEGVAALALTRRLYTTVGWSYYELYQDYSKNHADLAAARGAAYEDLGNQEIANLFSRAVFVQFTDEKSIGDLEISKAVTPETTTSFTFNLSLTDPDDKTRALEGTYYYQLYDVSYDEDGKETARTPVTSNSDITITDENGDPVLDEDGKTITYTGKLENGEVTFTLTNAQVMVIKDLPANAGYTVTETSGTGNGTFGYSPQVSTNGGDLTEGAETSGTLIWRVDRRKATGENVHTVEYTNALLPLIKLQKVDSDTENTLAGASFVLYYKDEAGVPYYYHRGGFYALTEGADYARETPESGQLLFANLPTGKIYYLKELSAPDGYNRLTQEIEITVDENGKISVPTDESTTEYEVTDNTKYGGQELDLTVKNQPGFELPKTGGAGTFPCAIGGTLLMACSLLCRYMLRRKGERRSAQ